MSDHYCNACRPLPDTPTDDQLIEIARGAGVLIGEKARTGVLRAMRAATEAERERCAGVLNGVAARCTSLALADIQRGQTMDLLNHALEEGLEQIAGVNAVEWNAGVRR